MSRPPRTRSSVKRRFRRTSPPASRLTRRARRACRQSGQLPDAVASARRSLPRRRRSGSRSIPPSAPVSSTTATTCWSAAGSCPVCRWRKSKSGSMMWSLAACNMGRPIRLRRPARRMTMAASSMCSASTCRCVVPRRTGCAPAPSLPACRMAIRTRRASTSRSILPTRCRSRLSPDRRVRPQHTRICGRRSCSMSSGRRWTTEDSCWCKAGWCRSQPWWRCRCSSMRRTSVPRNSAGSATMWARPSRPIRMRASRASCCRNTSTFRPRRYPPCACRRSV